MMICNGVRTQITHFRILPISPLIFAPVQKFALDYLRDQQILTPPCEWGWVVVVPLLGTTLEVEDSPGMVWFRMSSCQTGCCTAPSSRCARWGSPRTSAWAASRSRQTWRSPSPSPCTGSGRPPRRSASWRPNLRRAISTSTDGECTSSIAISVSVAAHTMCHFEDNIYFIF